MEKTESPVVSWLFEEGSFSPTAKLVGDKSFDIVTDHLGTPVGMYDSRGMLVWNQELDIWGKVKTGSSTVVTESCPFRFPGQYEDDETGLYYNRLRYFDPEIGGYISVDPIGLAGGNPTLFGYVGDPNLWVDPFGLVNAPVDLPNSEGIYILSNGKESYVGSEGIGEQGMNKRISSAEHKKAQKLLDTPGTKVQFVKVDLGTATSKSDRNNILRYSIL